MTTKRPYVEDFRCGLIGSNVSITGVTAELRTQGTMIESELTRLSCSGMPSCGQTLGSGRCPYKINPSSRSGAHSS